MTRAEASWHRARRDALRRCAAKPGDARLGLRLDLWRALGRGRKLPLDIDFRAGGNGREFQMAGGWAEPEQHGCWTRGPAAQLAIILEEPIASTVEILFDVSAAATSAQHPSQTVTVDVNGLTFPPWVFKHGAPSAMRHMVHVPTEIVARMRAVLVTLQIATSEARYLDGVGDDTREIGVALRRITVATAPSAGAPRNL